MTKKQRVISKYISLILLLAFFIFVPSYHQKNAQGSLKNEDSAMIVMDDAVTEAEEVGSNEPVTYTVECAPKESLPLTNGHGIYLHYWSFSNNKHLSVHIE
ncbi:MAG: hypothetical protein LBV67_11970 [Streptococcaceae bacterium]|nr:hypothetical protein [Streptococcaceae bacterium]